MLDEHKVRVWTGMLRGSMHVPAGHDICLLAYEKSAPGEKSAAIADRFSALRLSAPSIGHGKFWPLAMVPEARSS